ncbi:MAG: LacI family transcriptional regulator, partial [Firmicutes bacterium]|nr:LacI family transcriptional regulator [Bacillota bacterium]
MPTIKDVARLAGVAPCTVSNTLNGTGYVAKATRERVLAAVRELGYQPSAIARGLKLGRTNMIALIIPTISTSMFSEMIEGIEEVATATNYHLIVCRSARDPNRELTYLNLFRDGRVDGIILAAPRVDDPCFAEIATAKVPVVLVGGKAPGEDVPSVVVDNRKGASEAIRYLLELGHRRIGFINGPLTVFDSRERFEAVKDTLGKAGVPFDEHLYIEGDFTQSSGYAAAREIMSRGARPTALFVGCDTMAIGAMQALKDMGFRIPEDVAVVGFDDIKYAQYFEPPLTTVRQPAYQGGSRATKMLLNLIEGKSLPRKHLVM